MVILGGERSSEQASLLRQVRDALEAGVAGLAFGRNIWSHADPAAITRHLQAAVHPDFSRSG
jgi:DhnA family fructose-bisphosphate aldolase class Ia